MTIEKARSLNRKVIKYIAPHYIATIGKLHFSEIKAATGSVPGIIYTLHITNIVRNGVHSSSSLMSHHGDTNNENFMKKLSEIEVLEENIEISPSVKFSYE